jgi:hypothetical protein
MEGFIIYAGIIILIAIIQFIYSTIVHIIERRNERIRDQAAIDFFSGIDVDTEMKDFILLLEKIDYKKPPVKYNPYNYNSNMRDFGKSHLLLGKCPACGNGFLRVVSGRFGHFIGCSKYPACKFKKSINQAKAEYKVYKQKEQAGQKIEFIDNLRKSYGIL